MASIEELRQKFDQSPYAAYLGMKITDLSRGFARVTLATRADFLTWDGYVQGGIITSVLDQAFGYAVNTLENVYVAAQLNVNFLGAPKVGEIITAEATVLHAGKSVAVAEMSVVDEKGKLIARATGTTIGRGPRA